MRCFSNIMPNFALILHLLVDSIMKHKCSMIDSIKDSFVITNK